MVALGRISQILFLNLTKEEIKEHTEWGGSGEQHQSITYSPNTICWLFVRPPNPVASVVWKQNTCEEVWFPLRSKELTMSWLEAIRRMVLLHEQLLLNCSSSVRGYHQFSQNIYTYSILATSSGRPHGSLTRTTWTDFTTNNRISFILFLVFPQGRFTRTERKMV